MRPQTSICVTFSTSSFIWLGNIFSKKNQNDRSCFEVPFIKNSGASIKSLHNAGRSIRAKDHKGGENGDIGDSSGSQSSIDNKSEIEDNIENLTEIWEFTSQVTERFCFCIILYIIIVVTIWAFVVPHVNYYFPFP